MRGWLAATAHGLFDFVFPWSCVVCGEAGGEALCAACRAAIRWLAPPFCACCGLPVASEICGPCRLDPPPFARARAVAIYSTRPPDPLGTALRALKYGRRRALAAPLGALLAEHVPFGTGEHDLVVPVPLHRSRLRDRGFNQALLLARAPAARLGLPVIADALRRICDTSPQTSLDEPDRRRNVRSAFVPHRPDTIRGRRVLLVDDVVTSGATVESCSRALRTGGATRVDVLSLARALRPGPS